MGGRDTDWVTTGDIAVYWDCARETVVHRLASVGIEMTKFGNTKYLRREDLYEADRRLKATSLSMAAIARRWNCGNDTVRNRLRKLDIKPAEWRHLKYLTPEQLATAERSLGIEGMFAPLEESAS